MDLRPAPALLLSALASASSCGSPRPKPQEPPPDGGCDHVIRELELSPAEFEYWKQHMRPPPMGSEEDTSVTGTSGPDIGTESSSTGSCAPPSSTTDDRTVCEAICTSQLADMYLGLDQCRAEVKGCTVVISCEMIDECT